MGKTKKLAKAAAIVGGAGAVAAAVTGYAVLKSSHERNTHHKKRHSKSDQRRAEYNYPSSYESDDDDDPDSGPEDYCQAVRQRPVRQISGSSVASSIGSSSSSNYYHNLAIEQYPIDSRAFERHNSSLSIESYHTNIPAVNADSGAELAVQARDNILPTWQLDSARHQYFYQSGNKKVWDDGKEEFLGPTPLSAAPKWEWDESRQDHYWINVHERCYVYSKGKKFPFPPDA